MCAWNDWSRCCVQIVFFLSVSSFRRLTFQRIRSEDAERSVPWMNFTQWFTKFYFVSLVCVHCQFLFYKWFSVKRIFHLASSHSRSFTPSKLCISSRFPCSFGSFSLPEPFIIIWLKLQFQPGFFSSTFVQFIVNRHKCRFIYTLCI